MPKSMYLSASQEALLEQVKPYFREDRIEPTDGMIISAALTLYLEFIQNKKNI